MKSKISILLIIFFLVSGATFFSPVTNSSPVAISQTPSQINGITYEHGWVHYSETGNFTNEGQGLVNESYTEKTTTTRNVSLVTGYTLDDIYYKIIQGTYDEAKDKMEYATLWMDNATLVNWVERIFQYNNTDHAVKLNITDSYDVVMTPVLAKGTMEYLGQIPMNVTFFEFFWPIGFTEHVYTIWYIAPSAIILDVQTVNAEVTVEKNIMAFAVMGYYYRYSIEYSVDGWAYRVAVTDGENFAFQALMFNNVSASYTEIGVVVMGYYFLAIQNYTLTFTNGTKVPLEMYPRTMYPIIAQAKGTSYDVAVNYANLTAITTLQSLVAAFHTEIGNETYQEENLAIWATQKATTLVAYKDGNDNEVLDLSFNENGLLPAEGDIVTHVGFGEAYQLETLQYFAHGQNSTEMLYLPAYDLNFTKTYNGTQEFFKNDTYSFGNVGEPYTATPYWEEPTVNSEGNVHFKFGMTYDGFPMTWVDTTTGQVTPDKEKVSYMYDLWVSPENGTAVVSPTFTFGGITDSTLKSQMADTSLALPIMVEFFSATATHTVTTSEKPVNATRTVRGAAFAISTGYGDSLAEIEMPDSKKNYTVDGNTYEAHLSALNLVTIVGVIGEETEFPITTETGSVAGTATVNSQKEQTTVSFIYMQDLLVVSYPVWNGEEIVHDPDYNFNYKPTPQETTSSTSSTSSSSSSSSTEENTTSETTSNEPSDTSTSEAGLPFDAYSMIASIMVMTTAIIIKRKKK